MLKTISYYFIISLFFLVIVGCKTTLKCTNVSKQVPYKKLIGKRYVILKDFYIIQRLDCSKVELHPCGVKEVPKKLDESKIGKIINGVKIVGTVPKNSEFILTRITKCDLVSHIHIIILIPSISFPSKFNDVKAVTLMPQVLSSDFRFNEKLVQPVQDTLQPEADIVSSDDLK